MQSRLARGASTAESPASWTRLVYRPGTSILFYCRTSRPPGDRASLLSLAPIACMLGTSLTPAPLCSNSNIPASETISRTIHIAALYTALSPQTNQSAPNSVVEWARTLNNEPNPIPCLNVDPKDLQDQLTKLMRYVFAQLIATASSYRPILIATLPLCANNAATSICICYTAIPQPDCFRSFNISFLTQRIAHPHHASCPIKQLRLLSLLSDTRSI